MRNKMGIEIQYEKVGGAFTEIFECSGYPIDTNYLKVYDYNNCAIYVLKQACLIDLRVVRFD